MTKRRLASSLATLTVVTLACVVRAESARVRARTRGAATAATRRREGRRPRGTSRRRSRRSRSRGRRRRPRSAAAASGASRPSSSGSPASSRSSRDTPAAHVPNPTYEMVCTGLTGHAEVVQVEYDPDVVTYDKLLKIFWSMPRPDDPEPPGARLRHAVPLDHPLPQRGPEEGRPEVVQEAQAAGVFRDPIVTQLVPLRGVLPRRGVPDHEQNHPLDPYSMVYIGPKFDIFRKLKNEMRKAAKESGKAAAAK